MKPGDKVIFTKCIFFKDGFIKFNSEIIMTIVSVGECFIVCVYGDKPKVYEAKLERSSVEEINKLEIYK